MDPSGSRFVPVHAWVRSVAEHLRPAAIHWCDGSEAEIRGVERLMVDDGTLIALDADTHPGCFLHRSPPTELAYDEEANFIACADAEDAGPTNQWMSPRDAERFVWPFFSGTMAGRTMYVVPYLLGLGDYFRRWLAMGRRLVNPPKVFDVNWFRTSPEGSCLWPGFGNNVRVLQWILDRVDGRAPARETPIGLLPLEGAIDVGSMDLPAQRMPELLAVDVRGERRGAVALRREQREFVRRLTIANRSVS